MASTTPELSPPGPSSPTAFDVTEVDWGEDPQVAEPNLWDLSLSQGVMWWDWCLPPSPRIAALASSISKGATAPISTCTLLGNEWVGDSVIEATVHLLSPFCRVGTTLLAPSTLANLLHGGARADRWLPILAASSTVLLPVVRLGHWFLIRFEVAPGLCFFHNSLAGHAEDGLREGVVASLSSLTTRRWSPIVGHSDQQLDEHSCALFILRNIFILGLGGPPPGVIPQLVGWPTFFRIH